MTDGGPTIALLESGSFASGQPHDQFAWLRGHDPVHWHEGVGDGRGFWAVTRYEDVKAVGRDAQAFSSAHGIMVPDNAEGLDSDEHQMMISSDPPVHTGLRKLVAPEFVPRAAKAMRPRIEELAIKIIDGVAARGECDLVRDIAGLMPSYVIADMLGIPLEDGVDLYGLTEAIHASPESQEAGAALMAVGQMFGYAREVWERKRAEPYMRRAARCDTTLNGVHIAEGDKVVMYYGSANRDPQVFGATADQLQLGRTPNEHVAFGGGGPHFCLGAHIARIEIHALLRELLTRLVDLRPLGATEWLPSTFISGPKHLRVAYAT